MERVTNGLYIAMAGTLATVGLYSRLSHKADKLRKGGSLDKLPIVDFTFVAVPADTNQNFDFND